MTDLYSAESWTERAELYAKTRGETIEAMLGPVAALASRDDFLAKQIMHLAVEIGHELHNAFICGVAQGVTFAAEENNKTLEQAE